MFIRLITFNISNIVLFFQQFLQVHTFYYYFNLLFRTPALSVKRMHSDKGAGNYKLYKTIWEESKTLNYCCTSREHGFSSVDGLKSMTISAMQIRLEV